ncbi:MAG: ABC transporter permease [Bacteroidetes bacterium]|nr:ABC transporter permease [Bacteroidota bacterium]MBU1117148.1 ABC transporter permease [Bacteroidota bacterium]MBU1798580.1 ABC transporter permease [Bacteroidota bacterium]
MKKRILEHFKNRKDKEETIPKNNSGIISHSVFNKFFLEVASITIFTLRFFKEAIKPPYEINELMKQSFLIGFKSLSLVAVTSFILGLVLTVQSRPTLAKFGAESMLPVMVAVSIIREIGPVIIALIFAGKVGSGIGAELASMNVTEQIDAMQVSHTNPFNYLVVTRVISATFMLPLLVIFGDTIGLLGSYVAVNIKGNVSFSLFFSQIFQSLEFMDVFPAILKTFFFGFAIGLIGCYNGYYANKGTEGVVGKAANSAVVYASLMVFVIDMMAVQILTLFQN